MIEREKYIPENAIEAMGTYEAWIFMLSQFIKNEESRTNLDKMIDEVTWFDKEKKANIFPILEDMYDSLVFLGEDTWKIESLMNTLTSIK